MTVPLYLNFVQDCVVVNMTYKPEFEMYLLIYVLFIIFCGLFYNTLS